MDVAFLLEISFYLVVWVMTTLLHGHLPYFIEILEYVAIVEVFKKFLSPNFEQTHRLAEDLLLSENMERKPENDSVPIVYSEMVFKMCQSLDIKARLAPEGERSVWIAKFKKNSKSKPTIPVVKSKMIYQMCNALDIAVILSPTIEQHTVTLKPNRKLKKNKPPPFVRSVMVYKTCLALGLEAELIME
ncbi:hypothetical protein TNCT_394631 [Trichonephila clavata]|uniref:Uncharacterized protein n=1 Tax=Trichonephila clavata TaxID=2740835 RepID=A0A8X6G5G8_TRICU|nr:hypothetical protein TNCT_394631 [Trichonephila clavata]